MGKAEERAFDERLPLVVDQISVDLKREGFKKQRNVWRRDSPGLVLRFALDSKLRYLALLQGDVEVSKPPVKPFLPFIFATQSSLASRKNSYDLSTDVGAEMFVSDFREHSLPYLLQCETFDDFWRGLMTGAVRNDMRGAASPEDSALSALQVAYWHLGESEVREALDYIEAMGFRYGKRFTPEEIRENFPQLID